MTRNATDTDGFSGKRDRTYHQLDPYSGSIALAKLSAAMGRGKPLRMACLDVDSTLTGDRAMSDGARALLEEEEYVVAFVTSRTEEMLMTRASFQASRRTRQFLRPQPHLGGSDGHRRYVSPEKHEPIGLLDGDIIAGSTGTQIMIRQKGGGYLPDRSYELGSALSSGSWREAALQLLAMLTAEGYTAEPAEIESEDNYQAGVSDVFPPEYRVQLNFQTVEEKSRFIAGLRRTRFKARESQDGWAEALRNIRVTDDSNPEPGRYKVFLTPRRLSKARAVEHIVCQLCRQLDIERGRLSLLFAGDSFPDLAMGLLGGIGTDSAFLLVGGSRLAAALTREDRADFAGEGICAVRRRLIPEGKPGNYRFRPPFSEGGTRRLIVGDEAFPGTQAAESVYRYLHATHCTDKHHEAPLPASPISR